MAIGPVTSNPANGSFENAVKSDTSMAEHNTSGTGASADMGGASRPGGSGDISFFDDAASKKLPIGDDLFE
jgi:hypothetical protein